MVNTTWDIPLDLDRLSGAMLDALGLELQVILEDDHERNAGKRTARQPGF